MSEKTSNAENTAGLSEQEAAELNATAWLSLSDEELIRNSASLGLPADLHPGEAGALGAIGGAAATSEHVTEARQAADEMARLHAGKKFVDAWIKENR